MVKHIKYHVSTFKEHTCLSYTYSKNTQITYMSLRQIFEEHSASQDEVEDPVLLSTFQDLAVTARDYIQYTNKYGSVEDWNDTPSSEASIFRGMIQAGMAYTKHEYHRTPADGEFFDMARAGICSMTYAYDPAPMDMLSYPPPPDALQTVYRHMGYALIEDVVFLDMVASFEYARFWSEWGNYCSGLGDLDDWDDYDNICRCGCSDDQYAYIPGVDEWRNFPTAITHMRQFFYGFEEIRDYIFYDLSIVCSEYTEYTNDFDNWNDPKIAAFREFSAVAEYTRYVCPDYQWFQRFLELPGELRESIMHEYALMEREAGRLSKHQHYDEFHNPCCKWEYPNVLIACDNQNTRAFPDASTGRCPTGWLPNLAFTSHRMHEEVLVLMLRRTERFDLKYIFRNTNFKIATWFTKFLAAIPGGGGDNAVKHLNFPHMHWFNHQRISPALTNPSLELAAACKNLRKLDMTVHVDKVTKRNADTNRDLQPLPLHAIINRFKLGAIFGCTRLEEVYIDGIYVRPSRGGEATDLDVLEDVGKWMMKSFLVHRSPKRGIQVELVRRWGCWNGRVRGVLVTLSEKDMGEVKARIDFKKAFEKAISRPGCAPII